MIDAARLADMALGGAAAFAISLAVFRWIRRAGAGAAPSPGPLPDVEEQLRSKTAELMRVDFERMRHEEERRRAEHDLRILAKAVETMSLGVTITTMDGKIRYVNPADARLHGYSVEELIGRDSRIYAGDDGNPLDIDEVEPWARERINVTKSGERFPVRLVSDRVRNSVGEPIATVTICEDIRERIRIRETLERRERILEAVGFAAEKFLAQSSWEESVEEVLARLGQVTAVDRVHLEIRDHPEARDKAPAYEWRQTGPSAQGAAGPAALRGLPKRWEDLLAGGEAVWGQRGLLPEEEQRELRPGVESFTVVPLFVGGTWRGFLALESADAGRDWAGAEREALKTAARTLGAALQRHEDEQALARSEAKYRELLENANDLVQSIDPEGRFLFVNRAWKQALGYATEEIADLTVWNVVRHSPSEGKRAVLQSMMGDDRHSRVEAIFVAKDGHEIAVEGTVTRRYVDGQAVAAQGIFRDITERRQIDKMKQEFLSTVSHELRTPLTSIIASLGLLESGRLANNPQRIQELIQVAHRNSNRLLKLINNLLDLQKLAARKMSFRSDAVDIQALFEEALHSLQAYADSFQVELELGSVPAGAWALGDRDRLMQVLHNLLSNAIKFSPPHEVVTAAATLRGASMVLMVIDHGPGIPAEFCSRIFDQFTQADPSTTRAAGGSGLGLSIAKGLVEGMKGQIRLETRLGEGTTFFVDLPLAGENAATPDAGESGTWPRFTRTMNP